EVIDNHATVTLDLVKGQSYKIAFWAQHSDAPYTFDRQNGKVTVDYSGTVLSNDEKFDAFYVLEPITVTGPDVKTVTLRRPFAQINLGATKADVVAAEKLGIVIDKTKVTLSGVNQTLELFSGEAKDKTTAVVNFDYNALPGNDLTVNSVDYAYLAANYILANGEADVTELEFVVRQGSDDINTVKVPAVNYKRNYRTNILGRLLTSSVDFNIVIDGTPYGDIGQTWDGSTIAEPGIDDAGNYVISNAEQLAWFANAVNGTLPATASMNSTRAGEAPKADSFKGKTIKLASDISLNGKEWTPIGVGSNRFSGKFDGQGHTISNFKISTRHGAGQAALFGNTSLTVEFRDLTLENVNVVCPDYAGDYYGAALIGTMYGNVTIENVYVKDSYISGNNKVGALVAHDGVCSSLHIKDCHVSGVTFEALNVDDSGSVGGLVGFFQGVAKGSQAEPYGAHLIEQSSVNNCVFNVINSTNSGKRSNALLIGGINSKAGQELYVNDCSAQGNTWNEKFYVNGVEVTEGTFVSPYGELIGGDRNDAPKGKVFIDGKEIIAFIPILDAEGNAVAGVAYDPASATEVGGETVYTTIVVTAAAGMNWVANEVDNGDSFEGKTIKLDTDIILPEGTNWEPIGDNRTEKAFSGTFDGQNHLISGAKKSSFDGSVYGSQEGWGIFSLLDGATVKNLRLENEVFASYTVISGTVAGYAQDTNFENIEISNSKISSYNWYTGGVVGWASGNCTFKDIKLDETVSVGSLWDSHGQNTGGIAGGVSGSGTYLIEDCDIACVLDVINDVTSNYKWYIYRVAGMIIGNTNTTETSYNTVVTATATNVTCKNVTVTYGKWMNYHYCEEYGNRGWGRVEASDYVGFGIPEDHTHSEGKTHYECIPFDQLFGGSSNGSGHYPVKGLASFEGVTVNYPAEYTCSLCGKQHNVK
ncbi:MAG: hypothetical protein J6B27_00995, partial [Alistipes sp.]|nr:hypothetical protein [Alistipes sp.]